MIRIGERYWRNVVTSWLDLFSFALLLPPGQGQLVGDSGKGPGLSAQQNEDEEEDEEDDISTFQCCRRFSCRLSGATTLELLRFRWARSDRPPIPKLQRP